MDPRPSVTQMGEKCLKSISRARLIYHQSPEVKTLNSKSHLRCVATAMMPNSHTYNRSCLLLNSSFIGCFYRVDRFLAFRYLSGQIINQQFAVGVLVVQ